VSPDSASVDLQDPRVRSLFSSLRHSGTVGGPGVASGEAGREQHGTRVRFMLRWDGSRLIEARYQAYGCPHTLAVCEWLAQRLEAGQKAGQEAGLDASLGGAVEWAEELNIPAAKLGRLLIVEDALRAAIAAENVVK